MASRKVRLYVRTSQKYKPQHYRCRLFVFDAQDSTGTYIKDIKEACKGRTTSEHIELFYQNQPLENDESIAHYNFPNGAILETTSNPSWAAMLQVQKAEIKKQLDLHEDDFKLVKWFNRPYMDRTKLLRVLFNARMTHLFQPPHLSTFDQFVHFVEELQTDGMNLDFQPGQNLRGLFNEYLVMDSDQTDPVRSFLAREAARLGLDVGLEDDGSEAQRGNTTGPTTRGSSARRNTVKQSVRSRQRRRTRLCESCEQNMATILCGECAKAGISLGVLLCDECSFLNHRRHWCSDHTYLDLTEVLTAVRKTKDYCPRPYKAPFAVILAMSRALSENQQEISLDEEEIRLRAQKLTDTDLYGEQAGRVMGDFYCVENTLLTERFLQEDVSGYRTFELTQAGRELAQKLDVFDRILHQYLKDRNVPQLPSYQTRRGSRQLCLLVDENERDKQRLCTLASNAGIVVIIRSLPVAGYMWILAPRLRPGEVQYDGSRPDKEMLLPVLLERMSWTEYYDAVCFGQWEEQILKMKACGLMFNFLLIEGSVYDLTDVPPGHRQKMMSDLEEICVQGGFYVNYTSCCTKSYSWLICLCHLLTAAYDKGEFTETTINFSDLQFRVGFFDQTSQETPVSGRCQIWSADDLITDIFRESVAERPFDDVCWRSCMISRQLLIVKDLDGYNKERHALLYNCLRRVFAAKPFTEASAREIMEEKLASKIHLLVHCDVTTYWLLFIQIFSRMYVIQADSDAHAEHLRVLFKKEMDILNLLHQGNQDADISLPLPRAERPSQNTLLPHQPRRPPTATVTAPQTVDDEVTGAEATSSLRSSLQPLETQQRMKQEKQSLTNFFTLSRGKLNTQDSHSSGPYPSTSYLPSSPAALGPGPSRSYNSRSIAAAELRPRPLSSTSSDSLPSIGSPFLSAASKLRRPNKRSATVALKAGPSPSYQPHLSVASEPCSISYRPFSAVTSDPRPSTSCRPSSPEASVDDDKSKSTTSSPLPASPFSVGGSNNDEPISIDSKDSRANVDNHDSPNNSNDSESSEEEGENMQLKMDEFAGRHQKDLELRQSTSYRSILPEASKVRSSASNHSESSSLSSNTPLSPAVEMMVGKERIEKEEESEEELDNILPEIPPPASRRKRAEVVSMANPDSVVPQKKARTQENVRMLLEERERGVPASVQEQGRRMHQLPSQNPMPKPAVKASSLKIEMSGSKNQLTNNLSKEENQQRGRKANQLTEYRNCQEEKYTQHRATVRLHQIPTIYFPSRRTSSVPGSFSAGFSGVRNGGTPSAASGPVGDVKQGFPPSLPQTFPSSVHSKAFCKKTFRRRDGDKATKPESVCGTLPTNSVASKSTKSKSSRRTVEGTDYSSQWLESDDEDLIFMGIEHQVARDEVNEAAAATRGQQGPSKSSRRISHNMTCSSCGQQGNTRITSRCPSCFYREEQATRDASSRLGHRRASSGQNLEEQEVTKYKKRRTSD